MNQGGTFRTVRRGVAALLCLAAAGCSTATPVLLQASKLPDLQGRVNTTTGYAGEITTERGACRGSFTGVPGQAVATLEVSCRDGRSGIGTATIADGFFASGDVLLSDGSRLTIRPNGASFP